MKPPRLRGVRAVTMAAALLGALAVGAQGQPAAAEAIDWNRARELRQRMQQGATLSAEERAYLERAMEARRVDGAGARGGAAAWESLSTAEREQVREIMRKRRDGEALTEAERALAEKARRVMAPKGAPAPQEAAARPAAGAVGAPRETTGLVPLTELGSGPGYKGRDGGLYGGGRNEPPAAHRAAALAEAARIVPLDAAGKPASDGRVVLLSVGMSNTTQEFSRFQELAAREAAKSPQVVLVDGAQGGQTAAKWAESAESAIWRTVEQRLKAAGVTAQQVQVVWLKQANARPTEAFPAHVEKLSADLTQLVQRLKAKFPNLRLAYLSSRTYGGYATTALNPEPYAYESAFAVRDVINAQITGEAALNFDAQKGAVRAPLVLWGPYLWADGTKPRQGDGLSWAREDFREDGTHPSGTSGRDKVAQQLLAFFKSEPTARPWFVAR